jgi:hypothetical protein
MVRLFVARLDLNQLLGFGRGCGRALAARAAELHRLGLRQRRACLGRIGFDHLQAGGGQQFLRIDARRLVTRRLDAGRFGTGRLGHARRLFAGRFVVRCFDAYRFFGPGRGRRLMMPLGVRFVCHLGFALLLQPVLLELLRVDRLVGTLRVLGTALTALALRALAAIRTIAPVTATPTTAAAPAALLLFAFL